MISIKKIFKVKKLDDTSAISYRQSAISRSEHGGMMTELLMTIALAAMMIPFIADMARDRITRAENIETTKRMQSVSDALSRYIDINKKSLTATVGQNITRVNIADLEQYGAPSEIVSKSGDDFQLRILKSADAAGRATLRGIVILSDGRISPLRTREIVNLGGGSFGFLDENRAHGAFGAWRTNAADIGGASVGGIVETTTAKLSGAQYLYRTQSDDVSDGTMASDLNMGNHDMFGVNLFNADAARFEEFINIENVAADKVIFESRAEIESGFSVSDALVSGNLSADSKGMDVADTLSVSKTAKFSEMNVENFWVMNLNLGAIGATAGEEAAILKINKTIDMTGGNVSANHISVGFTGSITSKLRIQSRISDSADSGYFWDVESSSAVLNDAQFAELNRMAPLIWKKESVRNTSASDSFKTPAGNKNATAADFMNAISEMQNSVSAKYMRLGLE